MGAPFFGILFNFLGKKKNYTVTASYIHEVDINCFDVAYIKMYDSK